MLRNQIMHTCIYKFSLVYLVMKTTVSFPNNVYVYNDTLLIIRLVRSHLRRNLTNNARKTQHLVAGDESVRTSFVNQKYPKVVCVAWSLFLIAYHTKKQTHEQGRRRKGEEERDETSNTDETKQTKGLQVH